MLFSMLSSHLYRTQNSTKLRQLGVTALYGKLKDKCCEKPVLQNVGLRYAQVTT